VSLKYWRVFSNAFNWLAGFDLLFIYPMECGRERKKEADFFNQPLSY
jgi:hypothetical protein